MSDAAPKSAYELAMERLRKKDEEAGIEHKPITEEQRTAIAEIRNFYQAKLAEIEVLHHRQIMWIVDGEEQHAAREQEYRRDRERLTSERDAKIERARRG